MNMNKALQNLYHAVSGSTTTKVNISKLLVDIHYAITGVESSVKNNWSRIIDSMATNWPEGGGGGSSDFSSAEITITLNAPLGVELVEPHISNVSAGYWESGQIYLQNGKATVLMVEGVETVIYQIEAGDDNFNLYVLDKSVTPTVSGDVTWDSEEGCFVVTGDGSLTATMMEDSGIV